MQRLGGRSIFPKLQVSTRLWECQTRHMRFRRWRRGKTGLVHVKLDTPIYNLSTHVLDLDAEGAKGVRAFDPQLDGEPDTPAAHRERSLQPIKERIADFEKKYDEYESNFKAFSAHRFNPLHITDFDLLALALLDSPSIPNAVGHASTHGTPASYAETLSAVLDQNGVPHSIRHDTPNTMRYMRFRHKSLADRLSLERLGEPSYMTFHGFRTFAEIDRLVTRAIQSPLGRQALSERSDELCESLFAFRETEPVRLLSLLNNVLINLDPYKLPISTKLYELGIWTSLRCSAVVTAQRYIERRLKHGDYDDDFIDCILTKLLETSIASDSMYAHAFQFNVSNRLEAVFSLLTGYIPGEDQSTFSLRSYINPEKSRSFQLYIQCLARLGAFRTMWHEWHNIDSASHGTNVALQKGPAFGANGYFVAAVLDALAKNFDMTSLARSPEFVKVTGQFWEDCHLDMLAMSRSAEILALPGKSTGVPSPTPTYGSNWNKVYQIFREESIQKAFPALQAFLTSISSVS